MRLTAKFGLSLSLLSVAVLAITLTLLYRAERRNLLLEKQSEQQSSFARFSHICEESFIGGEDIVLLGKYARMVLRFAAPGEIVDIALLADDGRLLFHSDFLATGDYTLYKKPVQNPWLRRAVDSAARQWIETSSTGRLVKIVSAPVTVSGQRKGTAVMIYDIAAVEASIRSLQRLSLRRHLQAASAGLGLSLIFAWALARALSRPIMRLRAGAQEVGAGNLGARVPDSGGDELGELGREFNSMAQKLGELDRLKESFMEQITHDLRNPLTSIVLNTELLLMKSMGPLTEAQDRALQLSRRSGSFLAELIDNILDVTKLEAGKMELKKETLSARAVIEESVELLRPKADEYKVALNIDGVGPDIDIIADDQAFKRVVTNLVSNAIKFTPEGGSVRVIYARQDHEHLFSIADTGVGIPADKLGSLFQKFAQVAETKDSVRKTKGTGLGLVICKEIIEAHKGRIWVESEYKAGTTFHFTLPVKPEPA